MKKIMNIVYFLTIAVFCFGQDRFYANSSGNVYTSPNPIFGIAGSVNAGEKLIIVEGGISFTLSADNSRTYRTRVKTEDGSIGWFAIDAISVYDSDIFPIEITDTRWANSYYLSVLRSENREMLFTYEPFWRDSFYRYEEGRPWYVDVSLSGLDIGSLHTRIWELSFNTYDLIRGRIIKENGKFSFSFICIAKRLSFDGTYLRSHFSLNERGTIALYLDGDFLDVFINNRKMFTLVRETEEIYRQFQNLMLNNSVDLSNVIWPRRADGRMDIPPPIDMSNFQASHTTIARLNIRDSPNTTAPLVTTLELGTEVQVLETGLVATIGEITATWVRVLSAGGFTGWSFSGFLESIVGETAAVESPVPEAPAVIVPQADFVVEGGGMLLWTWFAIIGVVIVAGGAVLVIVRRKKKGI